MALHTLRELWGKAKDGNQAPGTGERRLGCARGLGDGDAVERRGDGVEERRIGVLAGKMQDQLGDGRGAGESADILRQRRAYPRDVERVEHVELASRLRG